MSEKFEIRCNGQMGKKVLYYETLPSTNETAMQLDTKEDIHGTLVIAKEQTAGKGRRGRNWESPNGEGIWMSLVLQPPIATCNASMLTLVMAMAVQSVLEDYTGNFYGIKWPNDIVADGKKICGILTQMRSDVNQIHSVVIGVGINVNTKTFSQEVAQVATSISNFCGKIFTRNEIIDIIERIMKQFETYYEVFLKTEDMSGLIELYNEKLINRNRVVKLVTGNMNATDNKENLTCGKHSGMKDSLTVEKDVDVTVARGINHRGELLVEHADGSVEAVMSGEVSVRGVYGYV